MNASTEPFGLPDDAPELARRFAVIMAGLGALIARRFLKMPHLSGFTVQLWTYLNRATRRFHRALTRPPAKARAMRAGRANGAQAGRANGTQADRANGAQADPTKVVRVRPVAMPSARGWIVRELGWEAAAYMAHLEVLLGEVATRAALAGAPGTGRILRPICRMLGVSAAVVPVAVTLTEPVVVVEPRLEPTGSPGVVENCEVVATSA